MLAYLYFLAKSMNPFIGRFGLSGSADDFFLAGDMGGDIALFRTAADDKIEAMLCLKGVLELADVNICLGPPSEGDNWSARSWLKKRENFRIKMIFRQNIIFVMTKGHKI